MPLPVTPIAVLRSLVQVEDVQALVWAWILVGIVILIGKYNFERSRLPFSIKAISSKRLIHLYVSNLLSYPAWWSNPSDSSFRPFLTDFTFRERLRLLHESSDSSIASADVSDSSKSPEQDASKLSPRNIQAHLFSTSPFAVTFGSRLSLSVRTPPYVRKDFRLFSVVTIYHSVPLHFVGMSGEAASAKSRSQSAAEPGSASGTTSDYTSIFIGAFGRWWVGVYALPFQRSANDNRTETRVKALERDQLEENREELPEWGIVEMRVADSEPEYTEPQLCRDVDASKPNHVISQDSSPDVKEHSQDRPQSPRMSPDPASTTFSRDTDSVDLVALAASVTDSQDVVLDLREQLQQLKSNSSKACSSLQLDLDELRTRKREEDKTRADTKAKTKVLDENRRQVEGTKREAEKRLKMAVNARTSKQNSIAGKKDEMESLRRRREGHEGKLQASASNKTSRVDEVNKLTADAHARLEELENMLAELNDEISLAEGALALEKANLSAIYEEGSNRDQDRAGDFYTSASSIFNPEYANAPLATSELSRNHLPHGVSDDQNHTGLNGLSAVPNASFIPLGNSVDAELGTFPVDQSLRDPEHARTLPKRTRGLSTNLLRNAFRKASNPVVSSAFHDPSPEQAGKTSSDLQTVSDFEAMKQAFQPTVASEEEGRRSWSAFDIWQSDLRDARHQMRFSPGIFNGSADSLPHFTNSTLMVPLDRSNSAGYPDSTREEDGSDVDQSRNLAKVKRAFRWPFRPSQTQGEVA